MALPEYDLVSLMKEYKREIGRYINKETDQYPPFPESYFSLKCQAILEEFQDKLNLALAQGTEPPAFPEDLILPYLDNTWHDTAEAVINNWIGKVYQLTNTERHIPFNENIDPNDPLNLK